MPNRARKISAQNNFTKGLVTEATGLTFPENACTDTDNCVFDRIGLVSRRKGMDIEENGTSTTISKSGFAISSFVWTNAGGDGNTTVFVKQIDGTLHFYLQSAATVASPLSTKKLASTITLGFFLPPGGTIDNAAECTYATGNGYLFVFHPSLEPIYCTYDAGVIEGNRISIQIRDFSGILEEIPDDLRSTTLTTQHSYNLQNQGWTSGGPWLAHSTTSFQDDSTGVQAFTVEAGLTTPASGNAVTIRGYIIVGSRHQRVIKSGTVVSYAGTTLTINVTSFQITYGNPPPIFTTAVVDWEISPVNTGYITEFFTDLAFYPSNSDVWWLFKNSSDVFDPATTFANVTLGLGPAPKGHFILSAFDQNRNTASGLAGITTLSTLVRPRIGAWFAGRIWYSGVDASFSASGDMPFATWTENIYFSQIMENVKQFERCYQNNDPTSEDRFDLLPSDGGVIRIQGAGSIYELIPIQNGLIVRAANGVWFITGSQGIGFTANDYTITKVSSIQSISSTPSVIVQGYPTFWNEEGIYSIVPGQQGGLNVQSLTDSTIASFFEDIPLLGKKFARGAYDPISTLIQWVYRDIETNNVTQRYEFNRLLNYNLSSQAFYPWSVDSDIKIHGVNYIVGPGGSTSPPPVFKYITSDDLNAFTFSEQRSTDYLDWEEDEFESFFVTGFVVRGEAVRKFQDNYVYIYSDSSEEDTSFKIRGQWDYATSADSGQWSVAQTLSISGDGLYKYKSKRVKIRGHGKACSLHVLNNSNIPFNIIGWSVAETGNPWI